MSSSDAIARLAATEAALGQGPICDGHLDPAGAVRAAGGGAPFWLRVLPDPGPAAGDGYGPAPVEARWLRVTPGAPSMTALGSDGDGDVVVASRVGVAVERTSWGTSAAPFSKVVARVLIEADGGARLWAAAAIADGEDAARASVEPLAATLAAALAVPSDVAQADAPEVPARTSGATAAHETRAALVRFTLGWEGDRLVLRDRVSRGPRESAGIWGAVVVAALVGAAIAGVSLVGALRADAPWTSLALRGGIVAVFLLGAFAFFHVTRHALRYRAPATPIAVFGDDRVVVAPWVRRDGAIDPRPEGRYGAGVRAAEVRSVQVVARDGRHAVSLDTEHGPIDVVDLDDAAHAEALRVVVERALAGVASPARRKTAIMRGRERAAVGT